MACWPSNFFICCCDPGLLITHNFTIDLQTSLGSTNTMHSQLSSLYICFCILVHVCQSTLLTGVSWSMMQYIHRCLPAALVTLFCTRHSLPASPPRVFWRETALYFAGLGFTLGPLTAWHASTHDHYLISSSYRPIQAYSIFLLIILYRTSTGLSLLFWP